MSKLKEINSKPIQDWSDTLKKELLFQIKEIVEKEGYSDYKIYITGSRVIGGFKENSDIDIICFCDYKEQTIKRISFSFYGKRVDVFFRNWKSKEKLFMGKFDIGKYDIENDIFYPGKDDEKYNFLKKDNPLKLYE